MPYKDLEYHKKYALKHKERLREKSVRWYRENIERAKAQRKKYRRENAEKLKEISREWRKANPEKAKEMSKDWRQKNPERAKALCRKWYKENKDRANNLHRKWYKKNKERARADQHKRSQTPKGKFSSYKRTAKSRKLNFDLTFEQFMSFWQKPCSYCGDEIKTIGLDRVDSSRGYSLNNIKSCCYTCNQWKRVMAEKEFLDHCKNIVNYQRALPKICVGYIVARKLVI